MSRDKLRQVVALLLAEAARPGPRAAEVIPKLRELAALYQAACDAPPDRRLVRALELMQRDLGAPWTVAALAKAVGLSRAAFARKFTAAFAASPLAHLHEQRMERAAARLLESDDALGAIAEAVGYQSEFAFSRAFKRHHGLAPGAYRRRARTVARAGAPQLRLAA